MHLELSTSHVIDSYFEVLFGNILTTRKLKNYADFAMNHVLFNYLIFKPMVIYVNFYKTKYLYRLSQHPKLWIR